MNKCTCFWKVLVGCEGINSIVARWLGFNQPSFTKRFAIRGYVQCKENHGLNPEFLLFTGHGYRCGIIPCDPTTIYWFFTLSPSNQGNFHSTMLGCVVKLSCMCFLPAVMCTIIYRTRRRNNRKSNEDEAICGE